MSIITSNFHSNALLDLKEECDLPYLFNFLQSRYNMKKKGLVLTSADSQVFYKLRHNVFKMVVSFLCSIPISEEQSFSYYHLLDSNRTPDYINYNSYESTVEIIEFSVANTKRATIQNKESFGKYNVECNELRAKGMRVSDRYFCMSLDSNVQELVENIENYMLESNKPMPDDLYNTLTQLKDEFIYINWHLNEVMPEILTNVDFTPHINIKIEPLAVEVPFKVSENKVGVSRVRNIFLKKKIMSNSRELLRTFRRKSKTFKFKLNYNFKDNVLYSSLDENGLDKDEIMNLLLTEDDRLLDIVNMVNNFENIDQPFLKYGDVSVCDLDSHPRSQNISTVIDDDYSGMLHYRLSKLETKTLSDCELKESSSDVEAVYSETLNKIRSKGDKIIFEKKNPFIFVPAEGLENGNYKPFLKSKFKLTNKLLSQSISSTGEKVIDRNVDYDKLVDYEKNTSIFWSKIRHITDIRKILKEKDLPSDLSEEDLANIKTYKSIKNDFSSAISEAKRTTYKNRVTIPLSEFKHDFPLEMEHYNKKSNVIYNFPETDLDYIKNLYITLADEQFAISNIPATDMIFSDSDPIGKNLRKTCEEMQKNLKDIEQEYLSTNLAKNTLFISQLCYSLMYYSNIKLNKNDFCLDNLGYTNVMLMVRGGQKITKTRRSRLFKLVIPISKNTKDLISTSSIETFKVLDQRYAILPWRQLNQSILKKGFELHSSFGCYYLSSSLESGLSKTQWQHFCTLKIFNMFSQKRKLEVWFSNLRYIYFNSTGTHTDVLSLVKSMVDYDYDSYFYLIQRIFYRNYKKLTEVVLNDGIYDLFYNEVYDNFDLCYEKFEETAFMAKAPVDQVNEHLNNLKKILLIHEEFKKDYESDDPIDILEKSRVDLSSPDLDKLLYKNDFMFDPKLCYLIGRHTAEIISTSKTKTDLEDEFSRLISDSVTNIATSKGMRNSDGFFWGDKGFDVVFDKLRLGSKVSEAVKTFPWDRKYLDNAIKETQLSYQDALENIEEFKMEFDAKDKLQYKGSREIYVMSDKTKMLQQPIENFMKVLCRALPNELMHKKSHIRPKLIHRKVFENRDVVGQTMYCTLDCTKWAPKSNIWKYAYFVEGMSNILPESFLIYFKKVWSLMFKKVVRIQKRYVEMLKTNLSTVGLVKHLKIRKDGDYELVMPYSFMMGIYNYLSSLMHAASQLYFNKIVSSPKGVYFNLMAHSDDSGGSVVSSKYSKCIDMFKIYEHYQKACNHLLSRKKSSLSPSSFELISIMYNNNRLIPMTHKFMTNVSVDPTGEGWYNDICTVVGKVVDAFNNGASLVQSYAIMLAQGEILRKAYHLPRSKLISSVPLHFGGIFNMHPLHLILLGSCCQEVMLDLVESNRMRDFRINTYRLFTGDYIVGRGSNVKTRLPYFVTHKNMLRLTNSENSVLSNLSLLTDRSTFLDAIKYYDNIKSSKFKYALLNVDSYKLLFSTLFFKLIVVNNDEDKGVTIIKLCQNYMGFSLLGPKPKRNFLNYSNEISYLKAAEEIYINYNNIDLKSKKSCKPMIYNTFMNLGLNLSFDEISSIKLYNLGPEYKELLTNKKKWEALSEWVLNNIEGDDTTDKMKQLSLLERKDLEKLRSCYMFIPSGVNIDTIERFWTYSIMYCTRKNFISKDLPQFFTMERFEFWRLPFDSLKHHYLLIKMALNDDKLIENKSSYINSITSCEVCTTKDSFDAIIEEIIRVKTLGPWVRFKTFLPFVTYSRPQYRGQNVWYGSTDFKINTSFGTVKHNVVEGIIRTTWTIYQDAYIDQLWHLYKLFCESRGVDMPDIKYDNSGFQLRRLAFNYLNNPYIPEPDDYVLILENSNVVSADFINPDLITDWDSRPTYEDELVDFCIYHVYDINQSFYQKHKLTAVKDLLVPKAEMISNSVLINNFLESKTYSILMLDSTHRNQLPLFQKYENKLLLGSLGSFSRALCLADELGVVRYRSSVSVDKIQKNTILESQTIQDIPLIDLYNSSSMSRVTYTQQKTLMKIADNEELDERDFNILNHLADKLGLVTAATMLTNYKAIISRLDPSQFHKIPSVEKTKCIIKIIEAIHNCMDEIPIKRRAYQWEKSKIEYWKTFVVLIKKSKKDFIAFQKKQEKTKRVLRPPSNDYLASIIVKGMFRADADNPTRFWNVRREDILASILQISFLNAQNLYHIIRLILQSVIKENSEQFYEFVENRKMYALLKKQNFAECENDDFEDHEKYEELREDVSDFEFPQMVLDEDDEDAMDSLAGRDVPEEFSKRKWKGNKIKEVVINTEADNLKAISYTSTRNFGILKIYHISDYVNYSWLGPCSHKMEVKEGLAYFCTTYPGQEPNFRRLNDEKLLIRLKVKEFDDMYKNYLKQKEKKVIEEEAQKKMSEISKSMSDEYSDYINEAFKKNNLLKTAIIKKWLNVDSNDLTSFLKTFFLKFESQNRLIKRKNKNYLPGFSGVLQDPNLTSELDSLFGDNYFFITSGQMVINRKSHRMLMQSIRSIYRTVNKHHKGFLTFLMSVLRESILTDGVSDANLTDKIMAYIGDLQDLYDDDSVDVQNTIAPEPMENVHLRHEYKSYYPVEWMNEEENIEEFEMEEKPPVKKEEESSVLIELSDVESEQKKGDSEEEEDSDDDY